MRLDGIDVILAYQMGLNSPAPLQLLRGRPGGLVLYPGFINDFLYFSHQGGFVVICIIKDIPGSLQFSLL